MKYIFNLLIIVCFSVSSFAQDNLDVTDHEVATWQFRSISEKDLNNFLYNEDNIYRKKAAAAIKEGKLRHWGLLRKVNGRVKDSPNFFFYNGFNKITDLDDSSIWGSGSNFGLRQLKSSGVIGSVHTTPDIQVFPDKPKPGNYIVVNYANPSDVGKFVQLQNEVWNPFIQKYVNDPNSSWAGWEVHRVLRPTGNGYNWNIATIDHFSTLSGALNPFPNGAEWPEGLEQINDLLPNGKFYKSVIYEVLFYEGPDGASK